MSAIHTTQLEKWPSLGRMVGPRVSHSSEADLSCASALWRKEITHHLSPAPPPAKQQLSFTSQPTLLTHGLAETLPALSS